MAELATGAVNSLLGVLRNEAALLGGVRGDVQFIQEEMESMNSFLMHLARTVPPTGEHDEQVRTWMRQVRLLAQDCNNCIDLYLYRGNPDIHLARAGLRRYLLWVPWFLNKMIAQHRAAIQLRELKERARDVGQRRLRYGVEVPTGAKTEAAAVAGGPSPTSSATASSSGPAPAAPAAGDDDDDDDEDDDDGDNRLVVATAGRRRGIFFEPPTMDDYFRSKLIEWMKKVDGGSTGAAAGSIPSIAIVTPGTNKDALALAREARAVAETQLALFNKVILVDIPALHLSDRRVRPRDALYYIFRSLERAKSGQAEEEEQQDKGWRAERRRKWAIADDKWSLINSIRVAINKMKIYDKTRMIIAQIRQLKGTQMQLDLGQINDEQLENEALGQLLVRLQLKSSPDAAAKQDPRIATEGRHALASYEDIIDKAAKKLQAYMEMEEAEPDSKPTQICLHQDQYAHILRQVFPFPMDSSSNKAQQALEEDTKTTASSSTATLGEDQIKEIVDKVKQDILREVFLQSTSNSRAPLQTQEHEMSPPVANQEANTTAATSDQDPAKETKMMNDQEQELQEDKFGKKQATGGPAKLPISDANIKEITAKMYRIRSKIQQQLINKGIADKINEDHHLKNEKTLIILKVDQNYELGWEKIRNALCKLGCVHGTVIVTSSNDTQWAKEFCNPLQEPLDYSIVGLYHETVLHLIASHQIRRHENDNYEPQIFREILDKCKPHEFCMKIFAHALHANPRRNHEELCKLKSALTLQQVSAKSSMARVTKKMLKFSCNDLPKEYMSCLLYLAIFPPGQKIRRSTLIGRWVVEGLITTEDWRWSSSVHQAERCLDVLMDRWLICPAEIGATGKVKSCIVGDLVHEFITKLAKKQRIVESRLSHHLARHFSIFNEIHLRASDRIETFLGMLSESSQFSKLKVLDLEGCKCFNTSQRVKKRQHYLKDICSNILLLKYLSLRGTDVTQLPSEINNLRELEVLDIRDTKVPANATRNVLLLKLKRMLAGQTDASPGMPVRAEDFSSVCIPEKIEKMVNMEVMYNVNAPTSQDLKDIRKLWQLRKLGVVIQDKDSHLSKLLRTINDLHECLLSLSITLPTSFGTPSSDELPEHITRHLKQFPKLLESLSISGTTQKGKLLPLLAKNGHEVVKVTLSSTLLDQGDLNTLIDLGRLHLRCLNLRYIQFTTCMLTFKKGDFQYLKYLLVDHSNLTEIMFEDGAAPNLEKIVLSFTNIGYISGVNTLPKLEEVELNNNTLLSIDNAERIAKLTLRGTLLEQGDLEILGKKTNMRHLELLDKSIDGRQHALSFDKDKFPKLNILVVDCSDITSINFDSGSALKLEKIVWTFTNLASLSGIDNLPGLKKLELNGSPIPSEVEERINKLKSRPGFVFKHNQPENHDQAKGDAPDTDDDDRRFQFSCWN